MATRPPSTSWKPSVGASPATLTLEPHALVPPTESRTVATATVASLLGGDARVDNEIALVTFAAVALTRLWQRSWSWMGAQLFATGILAAAAYLLYVAQMTYGGPRT